MPDEVGSGGEQVVATPAIEESLDAVEQASFDECMRNRANQIPGEDPLTAEAECMRVASQVNLTIETSGGDTIEQEKAQYLKECREAGFGDMCEERWEAFAGESGRWPLPSGDALKDQDSRYDTPTVGVKKDGKWEKHKNRPYTKKPE